jgi:hypothetical protein
MFEERARSCGLLLVAVELETDSQWQECPQYVFLRSTELVSHEVDAWLRSVHPSP